MQRKLIHSVSILIEAQDKNQQDGATEDINMKFILKDNSSVKEK